MKVNDPVPDFSLQDESGAVRSLKEFLGHDVVLFFYSRANTPG